MNDWKNVQAFLEGCPEVILVVHDKPDGDCLGSGLTLCLGLAGLGYKPVMLLPEAIPEIYHFLPGQEYVEIRAKSALPESIPVITVDCSDMERLNYKINESNPVLNIDHHVSNTCFGLLNIVDTDAAATGEIVYSLLGEAKVEITPEMATCLYVAISTDTGSFIYSNTTAKSLRIASELLAQKTDLDLIRSELHETRPLSELLTIKAALENLFISEDGKMISCTLAYKELQEKKLLTTETDGLIGMLRATEGVEIALLFKELQPGLVKISLRSKSYLDVNALASEFNGGGHARAAGCTIKGDLQEVQRLVFKKTNEHLKGQSAL